MVNGEGRLSGPGPGNASGNGARDRDLRPALRGGGIVPARPAFCSYRAAFASTAASFCLRPRQRRRASFPTCCSSGPRCPRHGRGHSWSRTRLGGSSSSRGRAPTESRSRSRWASLSDLRSRRRWPSGVAAARGRAPQPFRCLPEAKPQRTPADDRRDALVSSTQLVERHGLPGPSLLEPHSCSRVCPGDRLKSVLDVAGRRILRPARLFTGLGNAEPRGSRRRRRKRTLGHRVQMVPPNCAAHRQTSTSNAKTATRYQVKRRLTVATLAARNSSVQ